MFMSWSRGGAPNALELEDDLVLDAALPLRSGVEPLDPTAKHQFDEPVLGHLRHRAASNGLTVAQDGDTVAQLLDLGHAVGDEDDDTPLFREFPHDPEQPLHLVGKEGGGRLVEDQHLRFGDQRFDDLEDLPVRERKLRNKTLWRDS